jgi:hypothetical protein
MVLNNGRYRITIEIDSQYALFSTDNKEYDYTYFMEEYSCGDYIRAYSVSVKTNERHDTIAIIGHIDGDIENCAVLEDDRLVILVDCYLAFIDLTDCRLVDKIEITGIDTGLEIYAFDDGYIINGEIDIIKTNKNGQKQWEFSGRDIWVLPSGESSIKITDDKLYLTDWEGYKYCVGKNGEVVSR